MHWRVLQPDVWWFRQEPARDETEASGSNGYAFICDPWTVLVDVLPTHIDRVVALLRATGAVPEAAVYTSDVACGDAAATRATVAAHGMRLNVHPAVIDLWRKRDRTVLRPACGWQPLERLGFRVLPAAAAVISCCSCIRREKARSSLASLWSRRDQRMRCRSTLAAGRGSPQLSVNYLPASPVRCVGSCHAKGHRS